MLFTASLLFGLLSSALALDVPNQVHVSLAGKSASGDASTMAVSWNTKASTTTSTVKYGTKSHMYTKTSAGSAAAYYETFNHHVVLDALTPDTTYYYVVGDETSGWSREFSFRSAPLATQHRGNFSFFVFGDLGVVNGDDSINYIKNNQESVDLVWHSGDVSYADDSFLHARCVFKFCYEETLDKYMDEVQPWASKLPYMVTPGNHEAGKYISFVVVLVNN
jgi:phosphodiesterase/alkaline phosphatase D-like protein